MSFRSKLFLSAAFLLATECRPGLAQTAVGDATPAARIQNGKIQATPSVRLPPAPELAPIELPGLSVVATALDAARSEILPNLGATTYAFSRQAIETVPQGDNVPLSQLLLRAPGVAQDSFGQLHVRGDHANLQYRINGVQLPEGLAGFGAILQARLANSVSLITGALPAQYGFRTAGVIDIQTKTGSNSPGYAVSLYGGSRGTAQPSFEAGGRSGALDYYVTGEYLRSNIGIENPTSGFNASHDTTNQARGFATVSGIIDDTTRVSLVTGGSYGDFQIPTQGGLTPGLGLTVNGNSTASSADVNQRQREYTQFGIVSLQKHTDRADVQVSAFTRYSSLRFSPDQANDILFGGLAQNAVRQSTSTGLQTDASFRVNAFHTLRAGFLAQIERATGRTSSSVLGTDDAGAVLSDQPLTVLDKTARTGAQYGLYVQDEWRIAPRVTINYGARFDVVDEYAHDSQVSPRVNVVYTPWDGTTLHAGYSRYFQPPPFELVANTSVLRFLNTSAAPETTTNTTAKAERSHYFDVGASQEVLPGLTVGLDTYYKKARNLLDEGQFGAPIILTPFNYDRADVYGAEFSASYDRGPVSLYGNLAYSRAVGKSIISSQFNFSQADLDYISQHYIHLDHDQRWTGSAGAAYTLRRDSQSPTRLSADLVVGSGLRASTSDIPNGRALGGYYVANLSVVQKLDAALLGGYGRGTELRLDVLNLLDRKYVLRDGSGVGVGNPQYGLRRAILGGITQRF